MKRKSRSRQNKELSSSKVVGGNSTAATMERPGGLKSGGIAGAFVRSEASWAANFAWLAVGLLFLASGFSSLVYQVVWTRMLVLVFGATTFATSTVLSIFMGGLALGSFVAGRYADRIKNPFLVYGALEAIIGAWALAAPHMFSAALPVYKWIWLNTHASLIPFSLLRYCCSAAILLVPTTCMGATLPLISRYVARSRKTIGSRIGTLYALNTVGAVLGAGITGFVLLPSVGMAATTILSAAINFGLLLAVLILNQIDRTMSGPESPRKPDPDNAMVGASCKSDSDNDLVGASCKSDSDNDLVGASHARPQTTTRGPDQKQNSGIQAPEVKLVIAAFAVSGAIAMIHEVCWTRALLMVIGSSTYAFTIMLCAFLGGIFLGSIVSSRLVDRTRKPFAWFALLQIVLGAITVVSLHEFNYVPFWNLSIGSHLHADPTLSLMVRFILAGIVLAPITVSLGAMFPLVVKGCVTDITSVGRSVGALYACNTIGAIIGAFLAGFVLVPIFGVERTLVLCAIGNVAIGCFLLWNRHQLAGNHWRVGGTACGALVVLALLVFPNPWNRNVLLNAQGARRLVGHRGFPFHSFEDWRRHVDEAMTVRYWADGLCSNVGIVYHSGVKVTSLVTNGHIDASDDVDMPVQSFLSAFGMLIDRSAKDVAVIGWGSGQTVGTATLFPVRTIDAVELEPAVISASRYFHHVNHQPEADPRVHIIYNDGRNYLLATDRKYDLIVSEPSNPWQSGVCNLFTREFFEICRDRLNKRGMLSLWMQTAEVPPSDLCGVMTALNRTFPYTLTFYARPGNTVILASQQPIRIDVPSVDKTLADPKMHAEFAKLGLPDAAALMARIAVASDGPAQMVSSAFINTDDINHLEFDVGKTYEDKIYRRQNRQLLAAMSGSPWEQLDWGPISGPQKANMLADIAEQSGEWSGEGVAQGWLEQSLKICPTARGCKLHASSLIKDGRYAEALKELNQSLQLDPTDSHVLAMRGSLLITMGSRAAGFHDIDQALQSGGKGLGVVH